MDILRILGGVVLISACWVMAGLGLGILIGHFIRAGEGDPRPEEEEES